MSRIFISYSSKDRELVTSLKDDLEQLGHEIWFDGELTGTGGQKWWSNILFNVRQCDLFIFALTPQSLASEPCTRERTYALALNKRFIPVMLENVNSEILPAELRKLQFVDYREQNSKQGFALLATLQNLPPAQPLPDPLPPEPEVPMSPLALLAQRLDEQTLSGKEQGEIVFELESLFNNPATRSGADSLLRKLHAREDLTSRAADKIRSLISDASGVQRRPSTQWPTAPSKSINAPSVARQAESPSNLGTMPVQPQLNWFVPVFVNGILGIVVGGIAGGISGALSFIIFRAPSHTAFNYLLSIWVVPGAFIGVVVVYVVRLTVTIFNPLVRHRENSQQNIIVQAVLGTVIGVVGSIAIGVNFDFFWPYYFSRLIFLISIGILCGLVAGVGFQGFRRLLTRK